ncbi:Uncharacterised protein [Raoultella ornithinolytica]|nr:Uncharacterised protein [Raoultella ornithinolytica]
MAKETKSVLVDDLNAGGAGVEDLNAEDLNAEKVPRTIRCIAIQTLMVHLVMMALGMIQSKLFRSLNLWF